MNIVMDCLMNWKTYLMTDKALIASLEEDDPD